VIAAAARLGEMFLLGFRNLRGYPLRTFLTTLGIVFGVAAVIAMLAVGEGAQAEILAQIGQLGIRNVIVNAVKPPESRTAETNRSWISRYGLTFRDFQQIRDTVPGLRRVLPVHSLKDIAWRGSRKVPVTLYGVTPAHLDVLNLKVAQGRPILPVDEAARGRVCVIRSSLARELGYYGEMLALRLRIGDDFFRVVGVLADEEFASHTQKALGIDRKTAEIYAPYETVLTRRGTLSVTRRTGSFEATDVELNQIVVEAEAEDRVLPIARMVQRVLERNHDERDYEIVVPLELLAQRQKTQQTFNIVLFLIASISLLVGGIGIANIMLATITERTREIGIRRAMGAKKRAILSQFLAETVTISVAGGLLGVAVGVGLVITVAPAFGFKGIVTVPTVVLALTISCAVGILSGLFPALRAARLDPIQSLRYE
jgi:putative ABC transport system permease protein